MAKISKIKAEAEHLENFKVDVSCGNHVIRMDQPDYGGGEDSGPSPMEYFLACLSGCLVTMIFIAANQKGVKLYSAKVFADGELDLEGLLGENDGIRPGFERIDLQFDVDTDLNKDEQLGFIDEIMKRCPATDSIMNKVAVTYEVI